MRERQKGWWYARATREALGRDEPSTDAPGVDCHKMPRSNAAMIRIGGTVILFYRLTQ
jgi:hypothetical protein